MLRFYISDAFDNFQMPLLNLSDKKTLEKIEYQGKGMNAVVDGGMVGF